MVMKRTRYGQRMSTSARRQFKLSEPNCSIRLPLLHPLQRTSTGSSIEVTQYLQGAKRTGTKHPTLTLIKNTHNRILIQQQHSILYHINNTTTKTVLIMAITKIDWPRRQCLGHLYVNAIFSVARKSSSSVAWTATLSLSRLAWQASVSVVYISYQYQSVWIQ